MAMAATGSAQGRRIRIALHTIADLADQGQRQVCQDALRRIDESGAEVVPEGTSDLDALVVLVTHGNSAGEIVAVVHSVRCPAIIWAVRERWAWPSSSLAIGKLEEEQKPVTLVYGQPAEEDAVAAFGVALRSALALGQLRRSRIGTIGGVFPNLVSCAYDREGIRSRLGTEIIDIPFAIVREHVSAVREDDVEACIERARALYTVQADLAGKCRAGIRLHLAMKQIARQYALDAFAVECWSRVPQELGSNPCFGFMEDDYVLACEGDVLLAVTQLLARAITGANAYAGDVYDLDRQGVLELRHCGAPMSLAAGEPGSVIAESAQAGERGFPTPVCRPQMKKRPVILLRLFGGACEYVHMATGELISAESLREMTVKVRLRGSSKHFVEHCKGNHYLVVPGDVTEEIRLIGKWKCMQLFEGCD
jgi:L-fucose isomerase-like protein